MEYLHTMVRVRDLEKALHFFTQGLGLVETRRRESEKGRYTLVFVAEAAGAPEIELTYNWDESEPYSVGRNFGHVAYAVPDIYASCLRLEAAGYPILRPPRDGRMAFVRSPDDISIELLQKGEPLAPAEPWSVRENRGQW